MAITEGKFISCKRAIDRAYQDADVQVNIEDAIEWVGDVLDSIKAPVLYKTIITNGLADEDGIVYPLIPVIDYRAALPDNWLKIISVMDHDSKAMLYEITDSQYKSYSSPIAPNLYEENAYTINNDYIFTAFESGNLEIAYSALRVDEEGYPMVPDDSRINEAISKYIINKLDYKNWRAGRITRDVYEESKKEYHFAIGKASSAVNIPSLAGMESWKNMSINLVPRLRLFKTAFRHPVTTTQRLTGMNDRIDVVGDSQTVIINLSMSGLNANNSTNNVVYWNFLNSGYTRTINFYKEPSKSTLVAHATGMVLDGNTLIVSILPDGNSGLGGQLTFNISASGVTDDTDASNMVVLRRYY